MRTLIIGTGEIGQGLVDTLMGSHEVHTYDSQDGGFIKAANIDVLHICIPGDLDNFVDIVSNYVELVTPKLTIIHSTVPVGTTRKIRGVVAHSPVRGIHPVMSKGLRTYTKYIGYNSLEAKLLVEEFFEVTCIKVKLLYKSETTELAKLLSTTRYGVNLLFAELQDRLIKKLGLKYSEVVTDWERTYNRGLVATGLPDYQRPILTPPGEKIGGHCVWENAKILFDDTENVNFELADLLELLLNVGKGDREFV